MAVQPIQLAYLKWKTVEESDRQKEVVRARKFWNGEQANKLTERLKEFLGMEEGESDAEFNMNVCGSIVSAMEERLIISNVTSTESPSEQLTKWFRQLIKLNLGDALYSNIHEMVSRDGEAFVLIELDKKTKLPRLVPHHRYTSSMVGGDNFGCKAHYRNDNPLLDLLYISKRWIEELGEGKTRSRLTLYYPDRIEKYEELVGGWVPVSDIEDVAWPIPTLDEKGEPLGIQGSHWWTPHLKPEHWDVIPLQKALNKSILDLLAGADMTGFKMLITYGWIPTADGQPLRPDMSNRAKIAPGTILSTLKSKGDAGIDEVNPASLEDLILTVNSVLHWISAISSTPAGRWNSGPNNQVQSEGSQQEQKESFYAKVRKRQSVYTYIWQRLFEQCYLIWWTYSATNLEGMPVPEELEITIDWAPITSRTGTEQQQEWKIKKELGVPTETLWGEMGYTQTEIEQMRQSEEYQSRLAMMSMALLATGGDDDEGNDSSSDDSGESSGTTGSAQ